MSDLCYRHNESDCPLCGDGPDDPVVSAGPQEPEGREDDFQHYFNATQRLRSELAELSRRHQELEREVAEAWTSAAQRYPAVALASVERATLERAARMVCRGCQKGMPHGEGGDHVFYGGEFYSLCSAWPIWRAISSLELRGLSSPPDQNLSGGA